MTWTYSGNPADSSLDAVRFLIGDTDSEEELIQDEEINYLLEEEAGDVIEAAVRACNTIAARFSRLADQTIGDYSAKYSQKAQNYRELALRIREEDTKSSVMKAVPFAGGISVSDKETTKEDSDRVKPAFEKGMMDYPGTSQAFDEEDDC